MKDKSTLTVLFNDSDIGYFDDYFVEEVKKEIEDTLVSINSEIKEDCLSCEIEYHDKKELFQYYIEIYLVLDISHLGFPLDYLLFYLFYPQDQLGLF